MNSSDYDPITTADAKSFEEDGQEGSLQDALENNNLSSSNLHSTINTSPSIPFATSSTLQTPETPRSKIKSLKQPKPGKQHGATSFPGSPTTTTATSTRMTLHKHQTSSPSNTQPSSPILDETQELPSTSDHPFPNSPSPTSLRRPRQLPTSPNYRPGTRESALSIVAGGHSALPSRLSGWFQQAFSTSSSHLPMVAAATATASPPALIAPSTSVSPDHHKHSKKANNHDQNPSSEDHQSGPRLTFADPKRSPNARLHTRGIGNFFDKAVNYMFDSDAFAYDSRLSSDLWMMGGQQFSGSWNWDHHSKEATGDEQCSSIAGSGSEASHHGPAAKKRSALRRVATHKTKTLFRSHHHHHAHQNFMVTSPSDPTDPTYANRRPTGVTFSPEPSPSPEPTTHLQSDDAVSLSSTITHMYPPLFYHAFTSVVGLTYRSDFPPIPCSPNRLRGNSNGIGTRMGGMLASLSLSIGRGGKKNNNRAESRSPSPNCMLRADDDEALSASDGTCTLVKGLTSDAGWGCMLRTGQSLLANAILVAHLGREWRRPISSLTDPSSSVVPDPVYARLMSWFVDCSSPLAPFSVHRFASKGKELGKEIGEWFGPSTAAGAIKLSLTRFIQSLMISHTSIYSFHFTLFLLGL
ncbi:hypothetical protein DFH28DRAFT_500928 [Melampsora americana]|nr:hypothetical protein DFH28DRAFT_500928 [Melampsora americana]